MLRINYYILTITLLSYGFVFTQTEEINGIVKSQLSVENIHVINKTAQKFTVTDAEGTFKIEAKLNDTIILSSIQHKLKEIKVDSLILTLKSITVKLEEQINNLEEVVIGEILTGNLLSDINNVEGKAPINFFDVGIPGYTGKIKTQSERRLSEAGVFKPVMLLGLLGGSVPLNPIINGITGRTKMLKNRVEIEERDALIKSIKSRLSKDFLASNPLEETVVMDFFYFCSDDENFIKYCKNKNDFDVLIFLRHKYKQYMNNTK